MKPGANRFRLGRCVRCGNGVYSDQESVAPGERPRTWWHGGCWRRPSEQLSLPGVA